MGISSRYRSGEVAILTVIIMESARCKVQDRAVELSVEELGAVNYFF